MRWDWALGGYEIVLALHIVFTWCRIEHPPRILRALGRAAQPLPRCLGSWLSLRAGGTDLAPLVAFFALEVLRVTFAPAHLAG